MSSKPRKTNEEAAVAAFADLLLIRERLAAEKEWKLLKSIELCQEPLVLKCTVCRTQVEVKQRCKRKWCPCCQRALAAQRSAELQFIVERFRWPLFVTLTMKNVDDLSLGGVRHLRRAFGKLRHRKFWKQRVRGGIGNIEVTNIGNGWHPHLHAVVDCQWLSITTQPPPRHFTREQKKERFTQANCELERHWSKCLRQETSSVKVKRATPDGIGKEVLKYNVKGEDLVNCEGSIGDLIRALEGTRLMTTFGSAHGQCVKDVRAAAKEFARAKCIEEMVDREPRCDCGAEEFLPLPVGDRIQLSEIMRSAPLEVSRRMPEMSCLLDRRSRKPAAIVKKPE